MQNLEFSSCFYAEDDSLQCLQKWEASIAFELFLFLFIFCFCFPEPMTSVCPFAVQSVQYGLPVRYLLFR